METDTNVTIPYREAQCLCQDITLVSERNLYNHEHSVAIIYIRYIKNNISPGARMKTALHSAILTTISQHTHI